MSVSQDELAQMTADDDGWGCAITRAPGPVARFYRVIYAYGDTEVEGIRAHGTYGDALAEVIASSGEDCDDAWVEETAY